MNGPFAEITFHEYGRRVEWKGEPDWPFRVSKCFLLEGLMEGLYKFGPFEDLGDDPTDPEHTKLFRRKQ